MAVKQNNMDANGTPSTNNSSGNIESTSGAKTNVTGVAASGLGNKNMNPIQDGGNNDQNDVNEEDVDICTLIASNGMDEPMEVDADERVGIETVNGTHDNQNNIDITNLIRFLKIVDEQGTAENDPFKIFRYILANLSRIDVPSRSPTEMKRFKENILKVEKFLSRPREKRVYLIYLRFVCHMMITLSEGPSAAIAVIFQLFNYDMVIEAVNELLDLKIPDLAIRRMVRMMCDWLRTVNFCQNLNWWTLVLLKGLQERQKYDLSIAIALDNIEHLFSLLIVPVLRPKVLPIVLQMLTTPHVTPQIFHKILPKLPRVISFLKKQANSNDECADNAKGTLHQVVCLVNVLMLRFKGYNDLYGPAEALLQDFQHCFDHVNLTCRLNGQDENGFIANDAMQYNINPRAGLVNLGNTCYMNSVLQALAMTKEFSREILLSECKSPLLIKMQQQIALMLYSRRYELTPTRVLNATRPPSFSPGVQQDSSEFLVYLLETLHEQEVSYGFLPTNNCNALVSLCAATNADDATAVNDEAIESDTADKITENGTNTNDIANTSTYLSSTDVANVENFTKGANLNCRSNGGTLTSTIEKTFTGKLATTYKCLTCGWESRIVDTFRDLQLAFPEVENECASNYSVQDLMDYYCSPEKLDGENKYFCDGCRKLSDAERYISIISAPKNLILTLKHFKYDQKQHMRAKLMHKVFHDEKVSVKICTPETLNEIASIHYDLYAGVVHSGMSMDSGHYYTYAADATNKWYKFNDSIVTISKSEELHNLTPPNTPYILFYQMSARTNESPESLISSQAAAVKIDVPLPLTLEELPRDLRDYVNHDNCAFNEELRLQYFKNINNAAMQSVYKSGSNDGCGDSREGYDDDDDNQPPPASGCGGSAMNINVNRFVY